MSNAGLGTERPGAGSEGEVFPQHPRTGPWHSLKGGTESPWLQTASQTDNEGPERLNQTVSGTGSWDQFIKPSEGTTGPGGTLAK